MEQKLLSKDMDSNDMQQLIKDGKRIEKIARRGRVGQTQISMLRNVHAIQRKTHRTWLAVLCGTSAVLIVVILYFAIRAFQYSKAFERAMRLKTEMESLELEISRTKSNPRKLRELISGLESRQEKFSSVKSQLNRSDFKKFYSDPLEEKIDNILMRFGETDYHIPQEMTDRVRHHIEIYSGRMKKTIMKYIRRKDKYFPMIIRIFTQNRLPPELAYISMLESGLDPRALSHAGARGLWQFMPHTGRNYGLRVDGKIDERLDPEKATRAAAEYFKDLIALFGSKSSVMLAMAAYNAGEGRVGNALRKIDDPMRNRDFWYIYRMGYLAEETNEYIPRMMALMIISEDLDTYGQETDEVSESETDEDEEPGFFNGDF
jgi:hypothetical protein